MMKEEGTLSMFLNAGFSRDDLQSFLAPNAVLEWFGKTIPGRKEIANFFYGTDYRYEHVIVNTTTVAPFEYRPMHFSTRKEPEENFLRVQQMAECTDQLLSCDETKESIDMSDKESAYRTPPHKANVPARCPPAPRRRSFLMCDSDQESKSSDSFHECSCGGNDDDSGLEIGIRPLDTSTTSLVESRPTVGACNEGAKKSRMGEIEIEQVESSGEDCTVSSLNRSSKYSDLIYLEADGFLITKQLQTSSSSSVDEKERRDVKLMVSYRVNKQSSDDDFQIALILYKSTNAKPRRNLLSEFAADEPEERVSMNFDTPIAGASQFNPASNEWTNSLRTNARGICSLLEEYSVKRAVKRTNNSRGCLRF